MGLARRASGLPLAPALFCKSIDKGWNGRDAEHHDASTTAKEIEILERRLNESFAARRPRWP